MPFSISQQSAGGEPELADAVQKHERRSRLMRECTGFLSLHGWTSPADETREISDYCAKHRLDPDLYGIGRFLRDFEEEISAAVCAESGVFMPSGVMAQQIALRIWSDRARLAHIGLHETSHLEQNEHRAYSFLHHLQATLLGGRTELLKAEDIERCPSPLSAVLVELPQRRLGGALPSWEELEALKRIAKDRQIRLHLDGARLWECQPHYGRPLAEICRGFDSVYLSFYKGIGGISGSMLCGPADFIDQARVWQRRHGGNLHQLYPFAVSAKLSLEKRRHRFRSYHEKARSLARAFSQSPRLKAGLVLKPDPPQTNMMHVYLPFGVQALEKARDKLAAEHAFWLAGGFFPSDRPGTSFFEVSVGDSALGFSDEELAGKLDLFLEMAATAGAAEPAQGSAPS